MAWKGCLLEKRSCAWPISWIRLLRAMFPANAARPELSLVTRLRSGLFWCCPRALAFPECSFWVGACVSALSAVGARGVNLQGSSSLVKGSLSASSAVSSGAGDPAKSPPPLSWFPPGAVGCRPLFAWRTPLPRGLGDRGGEGVCRSSCSLTFNLWISGSRAPCEQECGLGLRLAAVGWAFAFRPSGEVLASIMAS